jgi:hypothetical protein
MKYRADPVGKNVIVGSSKMRKSKGIVREKIMELAFIKG